MAARRIALGLSLLAALALPPAAAAHATLERSLPANGAVLSRPPAAVRLVFDADVRPLGGAAAIRNGGGSVLAAPPRLERGDRRVVVVPLRASLPVGDYSVRWRVLSDDGHVIQGVLAFAVGAGRAPPVPALSAGGARPSTRDVVARWFLFAGLLAAAGSGLFGLVARGALRAGADAGGAWISGAVCVGSAVFAVAASVLSHPASWQTRFGAALNVGLIVAFVASVLGAVALFERRAQLPAWAVALALVPVPSVAGHALDAGRPWPNVAADVLHVAAAAAWLGTLLGLLLVVPAAAREAELERGRVWAEAGMRASSVALAAVVVLATTGVFRALWELTAPGQLVSTGYGRSLLVKTALLLGLAGVGWVNRSRLVPLLAGDGPLLARLRRNVRVELALFALLVGAVAVLTASRPGRDSQAVAAPAPPAAAEPAAPPPRGALVLAKRSGALAVGLAVQPRRLTVTVLRSDGLGESGLDVRIDGVAARPCGAGCYAADAAPAGPAVAVALGRAAVRFEVPARAPNATALVRRATGAFRRLRSVVYRESLASGSGNRIVSLWRIQAPDRLRYDIAGRGSGIVIGGRRWDREAGGPWRGSAATPLELPVPLWTSASRVRDARLLSRGRRTLRLSFVDPSLPAWFDAVLDRRTLLPRTIRMTAASHFMHHRYLAYNRPLRIRPPR